MYSFLSTSFTFKIIILICIPIIPCSRSYSFSLLPVISIVWKYHNFLFIHSTVFRHLWNFQFLIVANSSSVSMFLQTYVSILLDTYCWAWSWSMHLFSFKWLNCFLLSSCTTLYLLQHIKLCFSNTLFHYFHFRTSGGCIEISHFGFIFNLPNEMNKEYEHHLCSVDEYFDILFCEVPI